MENTGERGYRQLRIRNIGAETSPLDMFELFSSRDFRPVGISVETLFPEDSSLVEAFVTVAATETEKAYEWASQFCWRDQRWDVAVLPEGR
jgi:hypothetical protein